MAEEGGNEKEKGWIEVGVRGSYSLPHLPASIKTILDFPFVTHAIFSRSVFERVKEEEEEKGNSSLCPPLFCFSNDYEV